MNTPLVLPLPSNRDLREHFDADADYERLWRARLLRNAKVRAVDARLSQWHERQVVGVSNVVQLPSLLRRQA